MGHCYNLYYLHLAAYLLYKVPRASVFCAITTFGFFYNILCINTTYMCVAQKPLTPRTLPLCYPKFTQPFLLKLKKPLQPRYYENKDEYKLYILF